MSGPSENKQQAIYVAIGKRLRLARRRAAITQSTLAARTSLSRTSIANIERGEQRFMVHSLVEIATALNIPVSRLLPLNHLDEARRVENVLGQITDPGAARFVSDGLKKARVLTNED